MCDDCRAALESFEAVGGALLDISTPEEMSVDSFESVMALIESEPAEITQPASQPTDVPSALSDYIGGSLHDVKWRPIGLGVKQSLLKTSGNSTARLLYIPAGTAVPHHSHNGNELTLVLKGAFEDEVSRFGPGDVEMADEDLDHQPVAVEGEDCICLAVTDAPLKFQTLVHKLVQPFLKI
jgi:putative transcriptional regulator